MVHLASGCPTALHPKQLGLNTSTIACRLNVGYKMVVKAIKWVENSKF